MKIYKFISRKTLDFLLLLKGFILNKYLYLPYRIRASLVRYRKEPLRFDKHIGEFTGFVESEYLQGTLKEDRKDLEGLENPLGGSPVTVGRSKFRNIFLLKPFRVTTGGNHRTQFAHTRGCGKVWVVLEPTKYVFYWEWELKYFIAQYAKMRDIPSINERIVLIINPNFYLRNNDKIDFLCINFKCFIFLSKRVDGSSVDIKTFGELLGDSTNVTTKQRLIGRIINEISIQSEMYRLSIVRRNETFYFQ